jgi:hypothetical protein
MLRHRKSTVWFGVVLYTLVALGGVDGIVLCFGDDGHVGLETMSKHCHRCATLEASSTGSEPFAETSPSRCRNYCGSCVDIPIAIGSPDPHSIPESAPLVALQPVAATIFTDAVGALLATPSATTFAFEAPPPAGSPLDFIRTVVLLI